MLKPPLQAHSSDLSCNGGWTPISLNVVFYHSIIVLESLAWLPESPQYNREHLYTNSHCVCVLLHTIHRPWASNSNQTKQYILKHEAAQSTFTPHRLKLCMLRLHYILAQTIERQRAFLSAARGDMLERY